MGARRLVRRLFIKIDGGLAHGGGSGDDQNLDISKVEPK